jgi:hypothetical protein
MVERCTEIVNRVPEGESPVAPDGWQLLNIKDVLESVFVSLDPELVRVAVQDCGDFFPQFLRVSFCSPELSLTPFQGWCVDQHVEVTSP